MFKKIRFILSSAYKTLIIYNYLHDRKFKANRLIGEILRNTHSIEKGLSIENPRLGFGVAKIEDAFEFCQEYEALKGTMEVTPIIMFRDALVAYLAFHQEKKFSDSGVEKVRSIEKKISDRLSCTCKQMGGYMIVNKHLYTSDEQETMSRLFNDRHSVREFAHTPIVEDDLRKAIQLAMRCPSACNRQNYRLHVIEKEKFNLLNGWLDGVGGFSDDVEKFLLITGRLSDFRHTEELQYLFSPIVFASYLTLTLQLYGIGCCFIQRTLVPSRKNETMKKVLSISKDEQIVCALGIGNYKEKYKVPVSYRLSFDDIVTIV